MNAGRRKLVLVVEDNALNMELATDLLQAGGYQVVQAHRGDEALRLAESARPDLVLMDLSLPGLDGLTVTRRLRKNPATKDLPIIALTAHAMNGDESIALKAGCDAYLTKPVNTRTFVAEVTSLVKKGTRPE